MAESVVSYGAYIPFLRIQRGEYISALGNCGAGIKEKAVMDIDEDVITMAVEAARQALAGINPDSVGALALASANFPCQEKVLTGTVVEALGLNRDILAGHHCQSTLAGSEALLDVTGLMERTDRRYALLIISDAPEAGVSGDLEHGLGAGACAFLLAKDEPGLELEGVFSHSNEYMGLRYRLPGDTSLRDIGVRAYSSQAFNEAVKYSVSGLLDKLARKPGYYSHLVMHQADVKLARAAAKKLGFTDEQLEEGFVCDRVGDTGACSPFLGLCRVLDRAVTGQRIMLCTYGAGGGSHALSLHLSAPPRRRSTVDQLLDNKKYISYIQYLKLKKVI